MLKRSIFVALSLCLAPSAAFALVVRTETLDERVAASQVVALVSHAKPVAFGPKEGENYFRTVVTVDQVLKGSIAQGSVLTIRVNNTISEQSNDCCTSDGVYLVFLRSFSGDVYEPVGAKISIIRVNPGPAP